MTRESSPVSHHLIVAVNCCGAPVHYDVIKPSSQSITFITFPHFSKKVSPGSGRVCVGALEVGRPVVDEGEDASAARQG